jgi:hypothetical protein
MRDPSPRNPHQEPYTVPAQQIANAPIRDSLVRARRDRLPCPTDRWILAGKRAKHSGKWVKREPELTRLEFGILVPVRTEPGAGVCLYRERRVDGHPAFIIRHITYRAKFKLLD